MMRRSSSNSIDGNVWVAHPEKNAQWRKICDARTTEQENDMLRHVYFHFLLLLRLFCSFVVRRATIIICNWIKVNTNSMRDRRRRRLLLLNTPHWWQYFFFSRLRLSTFYLLLLFFCVLFMRHAHTHTHSSWTLVCFAWKRKKSNNYTHIDDDVGRRRRQW